MAEIKKVTKKTENPYVNLYELDTLNRKGNPGKYYVASRAKSIQTLELTTGSQHSDGVIIYSLYGENHDKVVLVRQYRYAINGYIYELPAGLVEPGEDYHTSAVREMKEETGLDLHPLPVKNLYQKPYYTTIGMTVSAAVRFMDMLPVKYRQTAWKIRRRLKWCLLTAQR